MAVIQGPPCLKCGNTTRYASNNLCIACKKTYDRKRKEAKLQDHQNDPTYEGAACVKCNNTKRYSANDRCIKCDVLRAKISNKKRQKNGKANAYSKKRRLQNLTKARAYGRQYMAQRSATDPIFHLSNLIRGSLYKALAKGQLSKEAQTTQILGCSYEELRTHLENQFWPGMTWENMGRSGWAVDHIIPLAPAKTKEDILKLSHFSNLQPLWFDDNSKKKDRLDWSPAESKHPLP